MAFWDVGTTSKLAGAPANYDQSALTEMQDWMDREAKRKRDEAEERRKREEAAAFGAQVASEQAAAIGKKRKKLINQSLEILNASPLAKDPTALAAASARITGEGEYVDPDTGDVYESVTNFKQIKAKKLDTERETRRTEQEDVERKLTAEAEKKARVSAKVELMKSGFTNDEAEAFLSERDPELAQKKTLDIAVKRSDKAGLVALTRKIMDLGSGETLIDMDPGVQKARASSKVRLGLRGIDAERAYANQQRQLASVDPYEREMVADEEYLQSLADASARLRLKNPALTEAQDPFAAQIKQIQNVQLRREMLQAGRTKGIDAGMFAQTTGAYQRLDKASAEAEYNKLDIEAERTRRAIRVAGIRAQSAREETERKYWERQVDVLQNREDIIAANKRQLIQSGGEIIASSGGKLADVIKETQANDPANYNLEGQQRATTQTVNRGSMGSKIADADVQGYTRGDDVVRPKTTEELTTVEKALAYLRSKGINIGADPTVVDKAKPEIGSQEKKKEKEKKGTGNGGSASLPFKTMTKGGVSVTPKTKAQAEALKKMGYTNG
jgi:hypothetical protein